MGIVKLLDCTLRDGGYINDWAFGEKGIRAIIKKLEQTGIEMIEVGFLKGDSYDPEKSLFPDVESIRHVLPGKESRIQYVAMLDMSAPIPLERITPFDGSSVDGIRVIFKKNKISEAYLACRHIKRAGYKVFVNFVSTDAYTDKEFIEGIERFNELEPDGVTIVDTFGMIKRKHFKRLVAIADNNLNPDAMLCYHAHNNLQQAFGNAEAMVEMNMRRDIVIDACVFGMGRGAGNLCLELFAEYMNDNYGKSYRISPMLEIMDEYLSGFYKTKFWGYSLPLYLSATHGCHPNYAIYLAEKNTLSEKAFNELLRGISYDDRYVFSRDKAEQYYKQYMNSFVDDGETLRRLADIVRDRKILLLAPGNTIREYRDRIVGMIREDTLVICVNFFDEAYSPDYVFTSNIRRFQRVIGEVRSKASRTKVIATSNIPDRAQADMVVNFSSFTGSGNEIFDNSGLMAIRLLEYVGVKEISIAGMDGYREAEKAAYYEAGFEPYHTVEMSEKNSLISEELNEIMKRVRLRFITPTGYAVRER